MAKTVEDLQMLRAELVSERKRLASSLDGMSDAEGLDKLVRVHLAIEALDAATEPEPRTFSADAAFA
jgi:hypothetical protein